MACLQEYQWGWVTAQGRLLIEGCLLKTVRISGEYGPWSPAEGEWREIDALSCYGVGSAVVLATDHMLYFIRYYSAHVMRYIVGLAYSCAPKHERKYTRLVAFLIKMFYKWPSRRFFLAVLGQRFPQVTNEIVIRSALCHNMQTGRSVCACSCLYSKCICTFCVSFSHLGCSRAACSYLAQLPLLLLVLFSWLCGLQVTTLESFFFWFLT